MKKILSAVLLVVSTAVMAGGEGNYNSHNKEGGDVKAYGGAGYGIGFGGNSKSKSSASTGESNTLAIGAASVGNVANDTCSGYVSVVFGLATFPVTLESCVALNEALFLVKMNMPEAAVDRLCQLETIAKTRACPKKAVTEISGG